jgi:hypothetical protein
MPVDFQLSGNGSIAGDGLGITNENICCAYGTDGLNTNGFDCLIFPNVVGDNAGKAELGIGLEQCGRSNGLVNMGQTTISGGTAPGTPDTVNRSLCSKLIANICDPNYRQRHHHEVRIFNNKFSI